MAGTWVTKVSELVSVMTSGAETLYVTYGYVFWYIWPAPRRMDAGCVWRIAAAVVTVDDTPFTPVAAGVSVVLPAVSPRMTMLTESCPAGMNAGSGETETRPGVPWVKVMKVPPAGAGSVSCTCAARSSLTFIE